MSNWVYIHKQTIQRSRILETQLQKRSFSPILQMGHLALVWRDWMNSFWAMYTFQESKNPIVYYAINIDTYGNSVYKHKQTIQQSKILQTHLQKRYFLPNLQLGPLALVWRLWRNSFGHYMPIKILQTQLLIMQSM